MVVGLIAAAPVKRRRSGGATGRIVAETVMAGVGLKKVTHYFSLAIGTQILKAPRLVDALLGNFGSKERHKMGKQDRFADEF